MEEDKVEIKETGEGSAEKIRCETCDKTFKDVDGLTAHNKAKHSESAPKERKPLPVKKIRNWSIFFIILGLIVFGIIWMSSSTKTLPPTDLLGHIEVSPQNHVQKEQMPIAVQKHMLEHADGSGPPGIVINYNCEDYTCEDGLIENLEAFAEKYPANVYVAPFKGMDAKIALTKYGKIETLEEFNEPQITNFIEGR